MVPKSGVATGTCPQAVLIQRLLHPPSSGRGFKRTKASIDQKICLGLCKNGLGMAAGLASTILTKGQVGSMQIPGESLRGRGQVAGGHSVVEVLLQRLEAQGAKQLLGGRESGQQPLGPGQTLCCA